MTLDRTQNMVLIAASVAMIAVLLAPFCGAGIELVAMLGWGWIRAGERLGPALKSHGVELAITVLVLGAFVVGAHRVLAWVRRGGGDSAGASGSGWKWRWTAGLAVGGMALLVGGIALVAATVEVGQLCRLDGSWFQGRHGGRYPAVRSASNLRMIGLGLLQYSNQTQHFPPGATFDADSTALHGWPTLILPFMDQQELYDRLDLARPWNDTTIHHESSNKAITSVTISTFRNPGAMVEQAAMGYATNAWVIGGDRPRQVASIRDGLAQTILAGEAAGEFRPWGDPIHWRDPNLGINRSSRGFGSPFPGGANFLFADGSVRFLADETALPVFRALCTPDGGEVDPLGKLE